MKNKIKFNIPIEEAQKGIWKYSLSLNPIDEQFKLSLNEGMTEEITLEEELIIKREDKNPSGSLKDRGMAYLISKELSLGNKDLVLSSSGNAAISAANYCELADINLTVFISPKTEPKKIDCLKQTKVKIIFSERAVSDAVKFSLDKNYINIRPSNNQFGSEGYQTISFEILSNLEEINDIFIPVSSGAAAKGIFKGFKKFGLLPRIHVCQTAAVCPIASFFDKDFVTQDKSLAGSLVARYTPLKNEIIDLVKITNGFGWVVNDQEIIGAEKYLKEKGIETSAEGAVTVASWQKAKRKGRQLGKSVCLLTGKKWI